MVVVVVVVGVNVLVLMRVSVRMVVLVVTKEHVVVLQSMVGAEKCDGSGGNVIITMTLRNVENINTRTLSEENRLTLESRLAYFRNFFDPWFEDF